MNQYICNIQGQFDFTLEVWFSILSLFPLVVAVWMYGHVIAKIGPFPGIYFGVPSGI